MELDQIEECRSLLHQRRENRFCKIFKQMFCLPSEKAIGFGIMLCFLLSIVLILAMQFYITQGALDMNTQDLMEDDDQPFNFSETKDRKKFMKTWNKGKMLLLASKKLQAELYEKAGMYANTSNFDVPQEFPQSDVNVSSQLADCTLILEHVKRTLKRCVSLEVLPEECKNLMRNPMECDPKYRYRSIDGTCNNLANPRWGMTGAEMQRLLKAEYADDVSAPRLSVYGVALPNVRLLSTKLYSHKILPEAPTSMLFMNFGLFLDHDIIRSEQPKDVVLSCCSPKVLQNPSLRHPGCYEIEIPAYDSFFTSLNITCMPFYRDVPTIGKCPGRREQMNVMTAYIDASDIYAPRILENERLREFVGGLLRTSIVGNTPLLPINEHSGSTCHTKDIPYKCFLSGDVRANMHLQLMALHTIWFREHNRLANELQKVNADWSDETLFQEARRILVAELQLITYREYLPIIFGPQKMEEYSLNINENEPYDGYEETVDAGIYNVFATAAFRFGHSQIEGKLEFRGPEYNLRSEIPLHETYMNPSILQKRGFDDIIRGMVAQKTHRIDSYITTEVRNRLLQRYNQEHGFDLTAITIQRGRDHGIPEYTKWRTFCGLAEVNTWDDMYLVMPKERVDNLREMYMSVDDVELAPAALAEYPEKDALVGPTYICLLGKQFQHLRKGDRFWFENQKQSGSFTEAQLKEIYRTSLARILCDISDGLKKIQKFPFLLPSERNPVVNCNDLPRVDITLWEE